MSDTKESVALDVVHLLAGKLDIVQKSVDMGNDESRRNFDRIEGSVSELKGSVAELKTSDATLAKGFLEMQKEIADVKVRVADLEADRNEALRVREQERDERSKEREAMISHVARLETSIAKTNEGVGAMVNELGIENRVSLGRNLRPGEKPPTPTFEKMEKSAKRSSLVQALIAVGVIIEALWRVFGAHH